MNGAPCLIYLLFEHQSTVDPLLPLRLLRYMVNAWERWLTEQHNATRIPPIIPVVLCHADGGWRAARRMRELYAIDSEGFETIRELVPDFGFVLEDLFSEHDHALMSRHLTALAQVTLLLLKHGRSGDLIEKLVSWAHLLGAALAAPDGMRRVGHVVSYVLQMTSRATAEQLV